MVIPLRAVPVLLDSAIEKLSAALDLLDPIPAAEERGRVKALILSAKESLEKHISRRPSGARLKSDSPPVVNRASVRATDAAAIHCLDAT